MEIKTIIQSRLSGPCPVTYRDIENFSDFQGIDMHHVCAYAFCDDKLVLVFDKDKKNWTPPGGHLEGIESIDEGTVREVKEETNMRVLYHAPIGHQAITEPHRVTNQTRSFCIVEPYGPFVADPDGDITEIKLINPEDAKQYFDWGVVGDHVLRRAIEMLGEYNQSKK